jgi:hypothetical protein
MKWLTIILLFLCGCSNDSSSVIDATDSKSLKIAHNVDQESSLDLNEEIHINITTVFENDKFTIIGNSIAHTINDDVSVFYTDYTKEIDKANKTINLTLEFIIYENIGFDEVMRDGGSGKGIEPVFNNPNLNLSFYDNGYNFYIKTKVIDSRDEIAFREYDRSKESNEISSGSQMPDEHSFTVPSGKCHNISAEKIILQNNQLCVSDIVWNAPCQSTCDVTGNYAFSPQGNLYFLKYACIPEGWENIATKFNYEGLEYTTFDVLNSCIENR